MTRQAGVTVHAPRPVGPYSQSARIGTVVYAAGQGASNPATGVIASSDIEGQTRQCLRNLEEVLRASGASLQDVLRVGVFLVHREDYPGMNAVLSEVFSPPYPARTTVYVGLDDDLLVEIDALAVLVE